MTRLLTIFALACSAAAQVQVRFSPEPLEVLRAMNVKKLGVWSVALCSDYSSPVIVPRERIAMAAGDLHIVEPSRASAVLNTRRNSTKKAVVAEAIEYLLIGTGAFGGAGTIKMSTKVLGDLAVATGVAHTIQDKLRSQLPDLTPFTDNLLTEPVSLGPAQCATRTVFAGLMHNAHPINGTIQVGK